MARNRVIYQSEAIYVSDDINSIGTGQHHQLSRVQSANMSYDLAGSRQDINQFGQLARIDSIVVDTPAVSLDLTYYLTNGRNEKDLGFYVQNTVEGDVSPANMASGQLVADSGRNFYMITSVEGTDANLYADAAYTANYASGYRPSGGVNNGEAFSYIGIGNGFLSDYTVDAAVGDFPTVSVTLEGLNANAGTSGYTAQGWGFTGSENSPYNTQLDDASFNEMPPLYGGETFVQITGGVSSYTGLFGIELASVSPSDGSKRLVSGDPERGTVLGGVVLPRPLALTGLADEGYGDMSTIALKPGDITLDMTAFDTADGKGPFARVSGADGVCVQSFSLSLPLSRSTLECLGTRFAKARVVDFPVTASLSVSALVNELSSGNLADLLDDSTEKDIRISIKTGGGLTGIVYDFKGAKFDAESFSSSIGSNKTVDLTFTTQIGGVNDTGRGVFMSGNY